MATRRGVLLNKEHPAGAEKQAWGCHPVESERAMRDARVRRLRIQEGYLGEGRYLLFLLSHWCSRLVNGRVAKINVDDADDFVFVNDH